jgi:uncharacterized protein YjbI with pentapeptide repeats
LGKLETHTAARARQAQSRFKAVWDAKKRRYICQNGLGQTNQFNFITLADLLATKNGQCARLPLGTELMGADLTDADLRGADFKTDWLAEAHFEGAHLEGADFRGTDLGGAVLKGAFFDGGTLFPSDMNSEEIDRLGMRHLDQ